MPGDKHASEEGDCAARSAPPSPPPSPAAEGGAGWRDKRVDVGAADAASVAVDVRTGGPPLRLRPWPGKPTVVLYAGSGNAWDGSANFWGPEYRGLGGGGLVVQKR